MRGYDCTPQTRRQSFNACATIAVTGNIADILFPEAKQLGALPVTAVAAILTVGHRRVNAPGLGVAGIVCARIVVRTVLGRTAALLVIEMTPVVGASVPVIAHCVWAIERSACPPIT